MPPAAQKPVGPGGGAFSPPWAAGTQAPQAPAFTDQQTRRPQSAPGPNAFGAPGSLPQTPEAYVQGRRGTYGGDIGVQQMPPGFQNGPQSMPQGPQNFGKSGSGLGILPGGSGLGILPGGSGLGNKPPQMFAPPQGQFSGGPGAPGTGFGSPASFPPQGPGSFNQGNPGLAFAPPQPLPGIFSPDRRVRTGPPGDQRRDGPPNKSARRSAKSKKKRRVPIWARVVIGCLIALIVLGGGAFTYYQITFAGSVNNIVGQQVARAKGEGDPNSNLTNGILTGPRVNILLLGSDTDQKFQGTYIAQTDIVVTVDPASSTVGMLSIPRDFYINVPGYGMHKLDEAYGLGGVSLSRATIEQDFGIKINYYAWVGLDGFIKVINEVGGVDVDVEHPIVDDNYPDDVGQNANNPYAVKRLYLPSGPQHLDGPNALEYVRSRHADLVGDFGRSVRQQQVLTALKTKLANPDIFGKLSAIAKDLQGFLKTDMQLPDVLKLMNFARSLDTAKIDKLTLGPPYSGSGKAPAGTPDAGADVVIPNCSMIVPAIQKMLDMGNNAVCNISDSGGEIQPVASTPGPMTSFTTGGTANLNSLSSLFSNSVSGFSANPADLFGVQSLLELMLMGTFESPDVF